MNPLHPSGLATATLAFLVASAATVRADETYKVGATVPAFSAKDQFGTAFTLGAETRVLLVSFDMATGKLANAKLTAKPKDFLPQHQAAYLANIEGMPAIGRAFALPKMRGYNHRIILGDDAKVLAPLPRQAGRVTVLTLQQRKIKAISFWDPAKDEPETLFKK